MQIDFGQDLIQPPTQTGFLDKQASIRKNWKTRYFVLSNGSMMVCSIFCLASSILLYDMYELLFVCVPSTIQKARLEETSCKV